MRSLALAWTAASLLAAAPARASVREEELPPPTLDTWKSLTLEATAFLGEVKYQHGDYAGAAETFRDSLNSSTKLSLPSARWMGLDLFRTAELAAREGDFAKARHHLEILLHRYPESEWAENGRRLLAVLPAPRPRVETEEAPALAAAPPDPALHLKRLQAALKADEVAEAIELARSFLERHPRHPSAAEVRLAQGALHLRSGEAALAAQALEPVLGGGPGPAASKARYLLGSAYLMLEDYAALRAAVPTVDPTRTQDKWLALAQAWRAAAEDRVGRHESALARYRALAKSPFRSPLKAYALAALAADADRAGRTSEAAAAMGQAAEEAARWDMARLAAPARLARARILERGRRPREAAEAYAEFAARHPEDPQAPSALYRQGLALRRAGRPREAATAFARLLESYPSSERAADAHLHLGQLYAESGQPVRAIEQYERMAAGGKGTESESLLLRAQVHYNRKRYREAIPYYWRFLESSPRDPKAAQVEELLLTSYWMGDRRDPGLLKAVELYGRHPIAAHIRWDLGASAYRAGDWEKAASLFGAFAGGPAAPAAKVQEALFFRAESLARLQRHEEAAEAFARLAARHPLGPRARQAGFGEGRSLYDAGRWLSAASAYARVGGSDRLASDAAFNRALALAKGGREDLALGAYEDLLRRFPRYPRASWAWMQVASLRESRGRLASAASAYGRVREPSLRPRALLKAGLLHEKLRRRDSALKAYEQLAALGPAGHPDRLHGLLRLGLLYEMRSQSRRAVPLYRQVTLLSDDEDVSSVAHRRLEALGR